MQTTYGIHYNIAIIIPRVQYTQECIIMEILWYMQLLQLNNSESEK